MNKKKPYKLYRKWKTDYNNWYLVGEYETKRQRDDALRTYKQKSKSTGSTFGHEYKSIFVTVDPGEEKDFTKPNP